MMLLFDKYFKNNSSINAKIGGKENITNLSFYHSKVFENQ